jgi:type IV pilus assembly protein PilE
MHALMENFSLAPRSRRHGTLRRHVAGVTLLELMAVVLVIGVLGMIAIPSYRQYSMRAQRTDAKTALLQLATNQERYYLANNSYGTVAELQDADLLSGEGGNAFSERGAYRITIPVADATTFTATATPVAGGSINMTDDAQCTSFTVTAEGTRTATGTAAATCW